MAGSVIFKNDVQRPAIGTAVTPANSGDGTNDALNSSSATGTGNTCVADGSVVFAGAQSWVTTQPGATLNLQYFNWVTAQSDFTFQHPMQFDATSNITSTLWRYFTDDAHATIAFSCQFTSTRRLSIAENGQATVTSTGAIPYGTKVYVVFRYQAATNSVTLTAYGYGTTNVLATVSATVVGSYSIKSVRWGMGTASTNFTKITWGGFQGGGGGDIPRADVSGDVTVTATVATGSGSAVTPTIDADVQVTGNGVALGTGVANAPQIVAQSLRSSGLPDCYHTFPGYAWSDWTTPLTATIIARAKTLGATGIMLQQQRYTPTYNSTVVQAGTNGADGTRTVSAAGLRNAATQTIAQGMDVGYKPHVSMPGGAAGYVPQANIIPGGIYSNSAKYTAGSNAVTLTAHGMDSTWVGAKVANPNPGHYNDLNTATGMDAYGTTPATFVTVTGIVDANTFTISRNAVQTLAASSICIAKDSKAQPWFDAYQASIIADMTELLKVGPVAMVDVSTEHNYCSIMHPQLWINLIRTLRGLYPTTKFAFGTGGTSDLFASVTFWQEVDFLSCTFYRSDQASGTSLDTRDARDAKWDTHVASIKAAVDAWAAKGVKLKVFLTELGARTIGNAGFNPLSYTGGTYAELDQARWLDGYFRKLHWQPWMQGFALWTTEHANTGTGGNEAGQTTYSIGNKRAGDVHQRHTGAVPATELLVAGVRYRRTR